MIPTMQQHLHDPENGVFGDCHRAALASILELPVDDVPHFADGKPSATEFWIRERDFLLSRGLVPISVAFSLPLVDVLDAICSMNPDVFCILGGRSVRGTMHSVVVRNGEIVHDPHPSNDGLQEPGPDGFWHITFIGSAIAHKR